MYLKQRLYTFEILENKPLGEQLTEFHRVLDDLENVEVKLQDEDKAILLLSALPKPYDNLVDAMLYGRLTTITLEEVLCALKTKELKKVNEEFREDAGEGLMVKTKFSRNKNFNKTKSKEQNVNKFHKKPGPEKETRKCFHCDKVGHLKKDCYAWKKLQKHRNQEANQTKATESDGEPEVLNVMDKTDIGKWILDSGCSFHMCPCRSWFTDLVEGSHGSVMLGNDQVCKVMVIGTVKLKLIDGFIRILTEVRFIPQLKRNLISLGALEAKGCRFKLDNGNLLILKGSKVLMT